MTFVLPSEQNQSKITIWQCFRLRFLKSSYLLQLILTICNLGICFSVPLASVSKTSAAEKIYLDYGVLQFSLPLKSLETYAKKGIIDANFANYASFFSSEQLEQLRKALVSKADVTPLAVTQFLYSPQGERILAKVAQVIQTKAGQSGFYALRSALIMATADEEGLTPLNILKQFPTYGIRLNSERGFQIIENLSEIVQETEKAIAQVQQQALQETATNNSLANVPLPNFSQPGSYSYRKQLLTLEDRSRDRRFPVDLYLPNNSGRLPLIIISHGLGGDRTTFAYLAIHLASYGFAVAVPEHPGSNAGQIQALFNGFANKVTLPEELIDRPLDIKFLLDYLERNYGQQLQVRRVGIIGQSFGAYTALALAGAKLNLASLNQACQDIDNSLNLSLLLQCIALELPNQKYNLRDERIVSAIAINPMTSAVFGQEGISEIKIPIMLIASSADPVTPALSEQIEPFTWLTTPEKYLALLEGATHFSTLQESSGSIPLPSQAIGPDPQIAQNYVQQLSLIFFESYVLQHSNYQAYLNASYAAKISRSMLPLSLVRSLNLQFNPQ
ncbi:putative dienelactone hydrolase [Stanieria sp. NIES-3757]|nr:putative dienelactone hydrolase [Stanieria sp. NIES-3757]